MGVRARVGREPRLDCGGVGRGDACRTRAYRQSVISDDGNNVGRVLERGRHAARSGGGDVARQGSYSPAASDRLNIGIWPGGISDGDSGPG